MELIITEKDNAARRISEILSEGSFGTDRRNGVNVYRWGGKRCVGLSGHVVGVDFPPEYDDWRDVEPVELVDAPMVKRATKENIVRTLQDLAREADAAVIATDYDREGELIGKEAYELVEEVANIPIKRVRFSSITEREVTEAFADPDDLDFDLAAAGEARQMIDLMWGAALTRFLSLSSGQLGNDFISVGRVQSPTLKLIVDREREIEAFDPEDYWELFADLTKQGAGSETFEAQYFFREEGRENERIWNEVDADDAERRLKTPQPGAGELPGGVVANSSPDELASTVDTIDDLDPESGDKDSDDSTDSSDEDVDLQSGAGEEGSSIRVNGPVTATVTEVDRRTRTDQPPTPFNTTQFISAASSLGHSAQKAMSVAEELYTAGYITYPRTDNTVYPEDTDPVALLETFADTGTFGEDAASLLEADEISPTRGEKETTDHPPIHPTGELPPRQDLSEDEWELYELVVRRFLATCAEPATWEHLRVVAEANGCLLKANGKRLLDPGYHDVYPYLSTSENFVPDVTEGESLAVSDVRLEAKQTQPPRRRGQSRLIETMEDLGIGTKSTRHNTLQKLYDRNYIEGDPPRPTKLAMAVVEAAEQFADRIVDEGMTAQLEQDMDAIARGEVTLDEVTEESREMLSAIFEELHESREAVGDHLRDGLKADKTLGPCPECGETLLVRRSRRGSYFVGCDGYPDCDYTLPLPTNGEPTPIDEECEEHGLRHVKMLAGRSTYVHGCPRCEAEKADEEDDVVIGTCPECGEEHDGTLAIKRTRAGGRLVGCTRYPECDYSLPLPRRGDIEVTDTYCDEHDLPELLVVQDDEDDPWELGCPICNFEEYQARQRKTDVEDLDGIGKKTAEKLANAGIDSLVKLADADPEAVANEVQGVSADRVRDWQAQAREAIDENPDDTDPDDGEESVADDEERDTLGDIEAEVDEATAG